MKSKKMLLTSLVVLASLLTGCGQKGESSSNPTSTSTPKTSSSETRASSSQGKSSISSSKPEESSESSISSETSSSKPEESSSIPEKKDVAITIDESFENGKVFDLGTFALPAITISDNLPYTVTYVNAEGKDIGNEIPSETGDYAFRVDVKGDADHKEASAFRTFKLRKVATITKVYYQLPGVEKENRVEMKEGEVSTFFADKLPTFSAEVTYKGTDISEDITLEEQYTKDGGATDLGSTLPTTIGDGYAINLCIQDNGTYAGQQGVFRLFKIRETLKVEISFTLDGITTTNEGNAGGASFKEGHVPQFSYATKDAKGNPVTLPDTEIRSYYYYEEEGQSSKKEVTYDEIKAAPGTYSYHVAIADNGEYSQEDYFYWFKVTSAAKIIPVVTISYTDSDGKHDFDGNSGGASFKEGQVPEFTYSIQDGEGNEITLDSSCVREYYMYNDQKEVTRDELVAAPQSYSFHVEIKDNDKTNAINRWYWFKVTSAAKITPVVTISYTDSEGKHDFDGDGGGASFKEGQVPEFTYSIQDGEGNEITLDSGCVRGYYVYNDQREVNKDELVAAPQSYSFHVEIKDNDKTNAINRWYWFTVTSATAE